MAEIHNIRRGTGRNRDAILRKMYGLDIRYGNGPAQGLSYTPCGLTDDELDERMAESAERARHLEGWTHSDAKRQEERYESMRPGYWGME